MSASTSASDDPTGDDPEDGYSIDDDDQLQPGDTLDDRGVDDVLDEGFSPPDHRPSGAWRGLTAEEARRGETLDERLSEEEPDVGAADVSWTDGAGDRGARSADGESWRAHASDADPEFDEHHEVGARRSGRLVAPDLGSGIDTESESYATQVGIDGAGASAEEAAVHVIDEDDEDAGDGDEDWRDGADGHRRR